MNFADIEEWVINDGPVVSVTDSNGDIIWEKKTEPPLEDSYFYVEDASGSANTVYFKRDSDNYGPEIVVYYSSDQSTWRLLGTVKNTTGLRLSLPANSKIYFKAVADAWGGKDAGTTLVHYNYISCADNFNVGGNILSLLYGDDYPNPPGYSTSKYAFYYLFSGNSKLISADALILSCGYATESTYERLFGGCRNMVKAPRVISARVISKRGCYGMFMGCTSLRKAPEISVTTVNESGCSNMFYNCPSLTDVSKISINLSTSGTSACEQMFGGCTSLVTPPDINITTLGTKACYYMFSGCTSLNNMTVRINDNSATNCIYRWLYNVAPTGIFNNYGSAFYTIDDPSGIPLGWTEHSTEHDYFYLEDISGTNNTVSITKTDTDAPTVEFYYSTDQTNWVSMGNTSTTAITATIPANSRLYLKATTSALGGLNSYNNISVAGNYNAGGYLISLITGNVTNNELDSLNTYAFKGLFSGSNTLKNTNNLIFPTNVTSRCYSSMFNNCVNMTTTIERLPATTLLDADGCYASMYSECHSLTKAPILPATVLSADCYQQMFVRCYSLTSTPALPAGTGVNNCYFRMFVDCTGLTSGSYMSASTLGNYSCYEMYAGCTSLKDSNDLRTTVLTEGCYMNMFMGCSNLKYIRCYATDNSATNCLNNWVHGVNVDGHFHKKSSTYYPTGDSGIPSGWTIHNSL